MNDVVDIGQLSTRIRSTDAEHAQALAGQGRQLADRQLARAREGGDPRDEISRLVITFNNVLDRIQHAFENQKLFLSNLSHEIRNPLNVIISQIEIVLANPRTTDEYKDTLKSILEDTRELNDVANKLMQLSRISLDNNTITFSKRVDELIWQTKENLQKAHPHYRINFEIGNLP